jgi:hypothetical protein
MRRLWMINPINIRILANVSDRSVRKLQIKKCVSKLIFGNRLLRSKISEYDRRLLMEDTGSSRARWRPDPTHPVRRLGSPRDRPERSW